MTKYTMATSRLRRFGRQTCTKGGSNIMPSFGNESVLFSYYHLQIVGKDSNM